MIIRNVLAKHGELASGTSSQRDKHKPEPARELVNVSVCHKWFSSLSSYQSQNGSSDMSGIDMCAAIGF
ncbi:hypothetical protein V6N13_109231 [Hibiscus sabdariffa]|uniref:Uncharacterized protein n=1 Tax=Hibiscus sabdariffa TaxID=183260 RepID=A0ABR2FNZ5_9ROSI